MRRRTRSWLGRWDDDRRRRAARWALAAVLVGSALAVGSVHTTVLCIVSASLAIVFAVASWDAKTRPVRAEASIVVATGITLVAWTFLQQVPLPMSVLSVIAPANADVWSRALMPLGEPGPSWAPISLDPSATRVQLLRGAALLLAFMCALRVAERTAGVRFLERSLLASSILVGVAALVHPALGIERVFGVFAPETASFGTRVAPLLNSNHLAAYLNIGACIALAWALSRRTRMHRLVPFALYLALIAIQVVVASRAGVAATLIGSLVVVWLVRRAGGARPAAPWFVLVAGGAAVILVAAFVLQLRAFSATELASDDTVKLSIIRQSIRTLGSFPVLGMGRGAFEGVFPAFRADGEGNISFTHPENIVVQWGAEWGLPVGCIALVALGLALRPQVALSRSSVPAGPAAALVAVGLHNMLDFSAEIPAVALALATCAACVAGGAPESGRPRVASWSRHPRWTAAVGGLLAASTIVVAAPTIGNELRHDRAALRDLALGPAVDRVVFADAAREAMLRHPAEPYLPLMGAVRAARAGDENPIPWIARTLERASVYGRAHLLLARILRRRSPAQARLEYRLAMEQDYNLLPIALEEGTQLVSSGDDALQLVPDGRHSEMAMEQLAERLRERRPDAAAAVVDELARRNPQSTAAARLAAERALRALRGEPRCATEPGPCVATAAAAAEHYVRLAPTECASHRLHAQVLVETGAPERAFPELDRALDGIRDRAPCAQYLVELATRLDDERRMSLALQRLLAAGCSTDVECATTFLHAARIEESRRNMRRALAHARQASERAPDRNDVLEVLARLASAAGEHAEALDTYERLHQRDPGNPLWQEKAAAERAAMDASRRRVLGIEQLIP